MPVLYCLFVWWFSTGAIVLLNNLPRRTFPWSFSAISVVAAICLWRLPAASQDASVAGATAGFTYGVLVWGWHEAAFFMGFLTGPRKDACRHGCGGWRHFRHGVEACLHHELAILATAAVVLWTGWGAPNQVGTWTFLALWGMRLSAKLNVFLGVLNLGEAFLPAHLAYLLSFMARRRMNWLMPFSLAGGTLAVAWLAAQVRAPGVAAFQRTGLMLLITMLALGVLEHAMLVLPLPFTTLWGWWLRRREAVAAVPALPERVGKAALLPVLLP